MLSKKANETIIRTRGKFQCLLELSHCEKWLHNGLKSMKSQEKYVYLECPHYYIKECDTC